MMNDLRGLWRGKRKDNGEWVNGYLIRDKDEAFICNVYAYNLEFRKPALKIVKVDSSTLGECTGLLDKNGKPIFEGDIVVQDGFIYEIIYWEERGRFSAKRRDKEGSVFANFYYMQPEIIGNIYDNLGLLS